MIVNRLEVIVYTADGQRWHKESTSKPTWPEIEKAIRRLDKHVYPFVFLHLSESYDIEQRLEIIGGKGHYLVSGNFDGHWQRRLLTAVGDEELVKIWTSDQGLSEEGKLLCLDLEVVLQAARYFFEHGHFDPSLKWESNVW